MHAHDWATAPAVFGDLGGARSVFTIHNLNYGADLIGRAMAAASACTTVSPTYANEVCPFHSCRKRHLCSLLIRRRPHVCSAVCILPGCFQKLKRSQICV